LRNADQFSSLLNDSTIPARIVTVLKVRERRRRRDRVDLVVPMVVEGNMNERVVLEPQHEIAHVRRLGGSQRLEHSLDPPLVLVGRLSRAHRVTRHKPLLHNRLLSLHRFQGMRLRQRPTPRLIGDEVEVCAA
jgi:hypothetical protein